MAERSTFWPQYVPHNLTAPQTSLWYNLEVSSKRQASKTAFICYDNEITFAALKTEAEKLAGFLQKRCGVAKGDRVLVFAQNSFQFVIAYYAILRADAVVVPINPMNLTAELRRIVADCGAEDRHHRAGALAPGRAPHRGRNVRALDRRGVQRLPPEAHGPHGARRVQARAPAGHGKRGRGLGRCDGCQPRSGRAHRGSRRPLLHAVHVGNDGRAQGLHAHAPLGDAHGRRGNGLVPGAGRRQSILACCRFST